LREDSQVLKRPKLHEEEKDEMPKSFSDRVNSLLPDEINEGYS
jgi:hypothetical protein